MKIRNCRICGKKGVKFASDGCKICGADWVSDIEWSIAKKEGLTDSKKIRKLRLKNLRKRLKSLKMMRCLVKNFKFLRNSLKNLKINKMILQKKIFLKKKLRLKRKQRSKE